MARRSPSRSRSSSRATPPGSSRCRPPSPSTPPGRAAPGGVRTTQPFSTKNEWESLDTDQANGCIRDVEHAYTVEGGLCVLRGNIALDGAILKTAGIDEDLFTFEGPAVVVESQE